MPVVPTYQSQVRQQGLQPTFQSTPDVSAGTRALGQALTQAGDVADRIDLRDTQAKASAVDARMAADWLTWDAQARRDFRGERAAEYETAAQEWWVKAAENYGKDLDPRTRALASRSLANKRTQALGSVGAFVAAEKERHADETYAADITTTIQFGVTTGDVAGTARQIREKAAVLGARKGWSTEQVQAEQLKNLSAMHLAQITKLASTNAEAAQEYYQANKIEVAAANQPRIEEIIRGEGDNQFATQRAAELADRPLAEQLAEAAKITDPQRREKTINQIRNNVALVRQAEREQQEAASDSAWQLVGQGRRVPEAILAQMSGRERVQLQDHLRARAERMAKGEPVKTDWDTYITAREAIAAGEKVDLRALTEKLAPGELKQLIDMQTSVRSGGVKQDSMLTDNQRIDAALVGLGIDKRKDPETAARLTNEIDRRVRVASAVKGGKDLTADEKQAIVDRVTMDQVYVSEWGRDPQKPVSLLTPEEIDKAYVRVNGKSVRVSSVPAQDRRQIIQALQTTGQLVTEQVIVEMYLAAQKGTRK